MVATASKPEFASPIVRDDLVERVWEVASSLKPTIPILIFISLACVLGTFANPENTSLNEVALSLAKQPDTFMGTLWRTGIYSFFELNDLFHSWWFMLILVLLALNLTACTIDRLPRIFNIALSPNKQLDEQVMRSVRHSVKLPLAADASVGAEAARLAAAFRVRGFEPEVRKADDGTVYLFAELGRYSRFGVYVVHAALLLILGGGIVGRALGYEGTINVFQNGGVFNFCFLRTGDGATYKYELPTSVRVTDFRHTTYQNGQDKGFESDLEVLGTGNQVLHRQTISVGHPLTWGGWTYYQASYQAAPERSVAKFTVVDKTTGTKTTVKVRPDDKWGPGDVKFQVLDYRPHFPREGPGDLGPAAHVLRVDPSGTQSELWVFQNAPDFDRENREDRWGLQFDGIQEMYFTGLQVARDPGAQVVFLGCFTMFAGLFIAFYTSHRRLWAKVTPTELVVAGSAHKNHFAFEKTFASLEEAVRGVPAAKPNP
jgi:cytochrome c biogenesis protein